jgi:GNAT superfamily N-acetyltransferase
VNLRIEALRGEALASALPALAGLRIAVFRDWPYLYDGDEVYERDYLRTYADSPGALVVGAFDGERLVGAATAAPMEDHAAELAAPFAARGHRLGDILYCGESVLLPAYRGRGVGHAFFEVREAHGRALGRRLSCFCAVVRDPADPRRPEGYRPLDGFWRGRGYAPLDGVVARFRWNEIGRGDLPHPMQFWARPL